MRGARARRAARGARAAALAALLAMASACSTLGSGPSSPEGLPHGGTGPFRLLSSDETDVPPSPTGATLFERDRAVENGMVADGFLFYGGAEARPAPEVDAGMPDAGVADGGTDDGGTDDGGTDDAGTDDGGASDDAGAPDAGPSGPFVIDWSLFELRRIYRSAPRGEGLGFDAGGEVLVAREAWEGERVHDPWVLVLDDGRARLYYAAEGGIGVAEAPSVGGAFTRVGSGPIVASTAARRPSVIDARGTESDHAFLMYFERSGRIVVASSDDGLAFEEIGPVAIPTLAPRDERDSVETSIGAPGALAARTQAGRSVVRVYYESRRASGQVLIGFAGSFDGLAFEGFSIPVVEEDTLRWPAPRQLDSRITLLYLQSPRGRSPDRGALVVGIAPGGVTLQ